MKKTSIKIGNFEPLVFSNLECDCTNTCIQGGQKRKPLRIYQQMVLKSADEATFSLKLNVVQATEVNVNKHLLVLNILSIKYSVYDVKCDVNYWVYTK